MKTFKNRLSYYFRFTLMFLITALVIYAPFLYFQKGIVWEHDSYTQHVKAMVFISRWYRQSLRAILSGRWSELSTYSFTLGYGSDALTTLAYYGVGDPLYLLSAFVPAKYVFIFYSALIVFKNYLSGIAFSALCRFRWPGRAHDLGVIAGSLIYAFCGFVLVTCVGQPIFLNAVIVFPMVLLGIEKVRDGRRPWLFILAIFLSTVSNFYFLPSIVLMAVLYALFRYIPFERGAFRRRLGQVVTMFAAGTVGVAMGGVILLPMILTVFVNKRVDIGRTIPYFYDSRTCRTLPMSFLSCDEVQYGALCYAGTALLCVLLLFLTKGYIRLKIQFLLYSALLFVPAFGYLTNGFSYPINRWCWAYSALVGMITAEMWPRLFELSEKQKKWIAALFTLYFVVCLILSEKAEPAFFFPVAVTYLALVYILLAQKAGFEDADASRFRRAKRVVLYITIAGVCVNGVCKNYTDYDDRMSTYKDQKSLALPEKNAGASPANFRNMWINDTSQIVYTIGHDTTKFERVSNAEGDYWYQNTSLLNGISSTQSFWSINNSNVLEYLDKLGVSDANNNAWQFTNLDNRAILNELASVGYLYCLHPEKLPAGYAQDPLDADTAKSVYPNENPLSLGYTYSRTISSKQFEALSPAERQEILLTHAVLDDPGALHDTSSAADLAASLEVREVPYSFTPLCKDVVQTDGQTFVVTADNATGMFSFDKLDQGECYLYMKNVQFRQTTNPEIFSDDPAFDPDGLYTQEMWDNLYSPYDKYMDHKHTATDPPTRNIKILADFYRGSTLISENTLNYILPQDEQFYSGRQDFLLNSYSLRKPVDCIVLTFPKCGIYRFDELSLISEPLTTYEAKTAALAKESLQNVDIHQNPSSFVSTSVTGDITVSDNKLLCLTIPYAPGWKAYVDGRPALLEKVNIMFCGLMLAPGYHTIELRYETPGLLYGLCLSAAGFLLFLFWLIFSIRPRRKRRQKSTAGGASDANAADAGAVEADAAGSDPDAAEAGAAEVDAADAGAADTMSAAAGSDISSAPTTVIPAEEVNRTVSETIDDSAGGEHITLNERD